MAATKVYSLDDDLMPIMLGKIMLPNFEEVPLELGIANIAAGGGLLGMPDVMNAKVPGSNSTWGHWARYFLVRGQGGGFTGEGFVIWWQSEQGLGKGHVGRFAICKHEFVGTGSREQAMRGWRPGYCSKCDLDMSIDSGD